MPRRLLCCLAVGAATLGPAGAARAAGEPVMPLAQVQPGMRCTASTVVQGTTISTFDVDVIDVVAGDPAAQQPYILFRASGPAVEGTGIGEGFSGSPIRCPGPDGTPEIAGAISEGIGQYGNDVALATPIALVLGEPVDVPVSKVRARPRLMARAHPLAEPLSISGLSPRVAAVVQAAGAKAGRTIYAAPVAPVASRFAPQTLVPGASVAAGLSSGDIAAGAIGTVTYVDGDRLWAFGHPLDSAGARSLFLQDAYVYTVIGNPSGSDDLPSYKLAAPGHDLGTVTSDGIDAIAGHLGRPTPSYPMRIVARDEDAGTYQVANLRLADETGVGLPAGASALTQVGSVAVAQLAYDALDGAPARQSGRMCVRITLRESKAPLGFCNSYVGGGGGVQGVAGGPLVADFGAAASALDAYEFGPVHVTSVEVDLGLRRSLRQAYLLGVHGPRVVRRGHDTRLRLRLRRIDGAPLTRTVTLRVPARTPRGARDLTLTGTAADATASPDDALETVLDLSDLSGGAVDDPGPTSVEALRAAIAAIHRYDGVTSAFLPAGVDAAQIAEDGTSNAADTPRPALRDPLLRLSGTVSLRVVVR